MTNELLLLPEVGSRQTPPKRTKKREKLFHWKDWESGHFPELEKHSKAKLDIVRDYIETYIQILCQSVKFRSPQFRLSIVDGFAGGGVYKGQQPGSPFVIMSAVKVAEALLNSCGERKFKVNAQYFFIDSEKKHVECLKHQILNSEYRNEIDKTIFLYEGDFEQVFPTVVSAAKKHTSRVIFLLDQCGYTKVKPAMLREISHLLNHKAEFIINFAIEWLKDHLRDTDQYRSICEGMGLDEVAFQQLLATKRDKDTNWRYDVEAELGHRFWQASGCAYRSPFYIRPDRGHRGYWLLHLAPHEKARLAMAKMHWKHGNSHLHYGRTDLQMLVYDPTVEKTGYFKGYEFDTTTRSQSVVQIGPQIAKQVHDSFAKGITVGDLMKHNCNNSIADESIYFSAIASAAQHSEIIVKGPNSGFKRIDALTPHDVILPNRKPLFPSIAAQFSRDGTYNNKALR